MNKMEVLIFFGCAAMMGALVLICGCKNNEQTLAASEHPSLTTSAVVIGMEYSRFAGSCPGAGLDAARMKDLLTSYAGDVAYLSDARATKASVTAALEKAVKSDLCILYYSGHGGSEMFPDTGMEETDGRDEFLCLYDTYLRDNAIWEIISKSKGRVLLIFDCCHSQTMFRTPCFTLRAAERMLKSSPRSSDGFSMLCWSGCPDDTYSYGSDTGGEFTNALLRHFKTTDTYDNLWVKVKNDATLRRFESVQRTVIGDGFAGKVIFR